MIRHLNCRIRLLTLLFITLLLPSLAVAKNYYLNDLNDFAALCSGGVSYSPSPALRHYYCNGQFIARNSTIYVNNGSTIVAYGGYNLDNSQIGQLGVTTQLQSSNWSSVSYFDDSVIYGNINLHTGLQLSGTYVYGYLKNNVNQNISINDGSYISGYVEGFGRIEVKNSQVYSDVWNNTNQSIYIHAGAHIEGGINAGTQVTILDSVINGNVVNRSNTDIYIGNDSQINGYVDVGTTLTIDDSVIQGRVSNRSNNRIFVTNASRVDSDVISFGEVFLTDVEIVGNVQSYNHHINLDNTVVRGDATAANNSWATIFFRNESVVEGQCLYRTDPVNACDGTTLSPIAKYHFDESLWAGGMTYDVVDSVGGYDGRAVNNPNLNHVPFLPALENNSLDYGTCGYAEFNNRDNSFVQVDHSQGLSFEDDLAVSAWVKLSDGYPRSGQLFTIVAKDTNYEFHINSQGKIYWYWLQKNNQVKTLTSNTTIQLDTWYHITVDYDASRKNQQAKLYINGSLDKVVGGNGKRKLKTNFEALRLGNDANFTTRSFNGYIDEVTIFDRSLSDSEVSTLYRQRHLCEPTEEQLTFVIEPQYEFALTCEELPVLFKTINENGVITQPATPNFTVNANPFSSSKWCDNGNCSVNGSNYSSSLVNGQKTLHLRSTDVGSYSISGSWNGENGPASNQVNFVPYKFAASDINVIAGREYEQSLSVLACNDGASTVVNYTGTPTVNWLLQLPSTGIIGSTPVFSPVFQNNSAVLTPIQVNESGVFKVQVQDSAFPCSELSDCPESGIASLAGSFLVNARPWTFAICSDDDISGTSNGGVGYKASGESFDVQVKPIIWQSGGAVSGPIEVAGLCNVPVTRNFFDSNSVSTAVELTHQIDSPTGGDPGQLTGKLSVEHDEKASSGNYFEFPDLSWSEVGSVRLQAESSNSYLGMDINQGFRPIGRFYPDYFTIESNAWNDSVTAGAIQGFTYMNQPFESVLATVGAFNVQGGAVKNYGLFSNDLQAVFFMDNQDRLLNADAASLAMNSDYQAHQWRLNSSQIIWSKAPNFTPDGPYNYFSGDALEVSLQIEPSLIGDPVRFKQSSSDLEPTSSQVLPDEQPRLVFGRFNMTDVGGVEAATLPVPLQAQYWNGSRFITNPEDSFSSFDSTHYCTEMIWPNESDKGDNVRLTGVGTLVDGASSAIVATQNTPNREQIEIWLRLDASASSATCNGTNNGQTWLMYDWDQNQINEENPSAVVTFGIYRGNDRVIFRGEPGLTGQ